jgi:predicted Zn-dependent protease
VGTPGQYTPQPIPPQHQQLLDSEAHLKDVMLRWQQRAQTAGAGPAIMHYYNLAVQNWKQAATAARYGTPFHPEA